MYRCTDCEKIFENYKTVVGRHGLNNPPFERIAVCPYCGSTAVTEIEVRHCRCCGARLKDGQKEYCGKECRIRGLKLWRMENARRKKLLGSGIAVIVNELEKYNSLHKTDYSYGKYVSLIRPKLIRKDGSICLA